MTKPINMKTLGGVSYDANLVKSATKLKNGKYQLIFNTGEKFVYPEQKPSDYKKADGGKNKKPYIKQTVDKNLLYDDNYYDIAYVMGATFSSSKKAISHVKLTDSYKTTINLAANDSKVFGDDASIVGGAENQLKLDPKDKAKINNFINIDEDHYTQYTQTSGIEGGVSR